MGRAVTSREGLQSIAIPVARYLAISFILGIGVFILYIGLITLFLILLGFPMPSSVLIIVIGSILCFVGMGIAAPSIISLGGALSTHARDSASKLSSYLSARGIDIQGFSAEINTIRSNKPSLLTSLKLLIISMVLLFLFLLSILTPLDTLVRLALVLITGVVSPVAIISSIYSLIEDLEIWLYIHRSQEISIVRKISREDPLIERVDSKRSSISLGIFLAIITLGLYIIYSLSTSILNLSRHMEWHSELDETIGRIRI
ncbi:MAG: hypothetical protein QXQ57_03085 [Sulfolobales archaeon]